MILEVVSLMTMPGAQPAFERDVARAEPLLRDAAGYLSHELRRSVENDQRYVLLIEWRRLEDPTRGFRRSHAFERVRQMLQRHFLTAPEVELFMAVTPQVAPAHSID